MLFEGQCEGLGATGAAAKFGYSKARYFQLLHLLQDHGALALRSQPTGPKSNYRRTDEIVRQVIHEAALCHCSLRCGRTLNLNIRYAQMSLAPVAQAVIYQLR